MSRISSDSLRSRSDARFRRALAITVIALLALCVGFLALGFAQGPKLSSAQVDATAVVEKSNQQLRLFANQAIAQIGADQVTIVPAVDFTVSTDGALIVLQFGERLLYHTHYDVEVRGVSSPSIAQHSTLSYSFTTGSADAFYLDRGEPDDAIVRTGVSGADRTVVYEAAGIHDFVRVGKALAVTSGGADGLSELSLVTTSTGEAEQVPLPDPGTIGQLDASTSTSTIGYTLVPPDGDTVGDATLYTMDLDAGRTPTAIVGLDGAPLKVLSWFFVPGTADIVALSIERTLSYVTADGTVLPIGQYTSLLGLSPDGATAIVTDAVGTALVTIADGTEQRLELSPFDGQQQPFTGATALLPNGDRLSKGVIVEGGAYTVALLLDDGNATTVLYRTVDDAGSIENFRVSPNGQYVALEVVPNIAVSTPDRYPVNGRATSITTIIIEIATGGQPRSVEGFDWHW